MYSKVGVSEDSASDGAVLGIELGTGNGSADDGALFGMELGASDGTSGGALLGHASVVVALLGWLKVLLLMVLLLMVLLLMT